MGERHNGLKKYLKDKHFEINMYYNPDNGMPVFRESDAKIFMGVFIIDQVRAFKGMSGAKINYFDSFDDFLFVYDGGKRTEPACVIPAELENQIRYDEKGDCYISLLIASFPAANDFLKMEFIVAGIYTGDDGTI